MSTSWNEQFMLKYGGIDYKATGKWVLAGTIHANASVASSL